MWGQTIEKKKKKPRFALAMLPGSADKAAPDKAPAGGGELSLCSACLPLNKDHF